MTDEERLKQQMAKIGSRYLARTLGELQRMQELLNAVLSGSPAMLKDLEHLAHKIHGSGAMFGFDTLSDHAGQVEHLAGFLGKGDRAEQFSNLSEHELQDRLRDCVAKLDEVTRAAAKERGIEPNVS
jgi:HPt (histidine-containing phosphotransfer) domain-containing protein